MFVNNFGKYTMNTYPMVKYILLAALCLAAAPVHAGELVSLQAESVDIGSFHGIIYYTSEHDGFRVVATIADGDEGLPVRFEAILTETQKLSISVPGKLNEQSRVLEISRAGDKLVIARPQTSNDKLSQ
jgi:hypothetical protein